jgi:hypothetical protein
MTIYANVGHILLKRGNTTQSTAYTGPLGELTYDTDLRTIRVHDGITVGGNVILVNQITLTAYQTYANANASTQASNINSINANIGSFYTYANTQFSAASYSNSNVESYIGANVGSLLTNAASQATGINSINANIGSFYTYANLHFTDSSYSNSNVASYLSTYTGNVSAANIIYSDGSKSTSAKWTLVESFTGLGNSLPLTVTPTSTATYYGSKYNEFLVKFVAGTASATTTTGIIPLPADSADTWQCGFVYGFGENSIRWASGSASTWLIRHGFAGTNNSVYVYAR